MNNYGYKVCYKKQSKERLKIYLIVNSYDLAEFHIRWYANHEPPNKTLLDVTWIIVPVKTYAEYKRLWRDVPF